MNFLFTITDSYAPFCGVTMQSIVDNNPDLELNFYIVCPDISEVNKRRLSWEGYVELPQNVNVFFIELGPSDIDLLNEVGKNLRSTHNTSFLLRLLAERLLPENIHKILYMDVDVVVDSSLRELDNYEFADYIGAAVVKDVVRESDYSRLKIDRALHKYFNAGIMLINLDYWRIHSVGRRCLDMLCNNTSISFMPDQDALNVVLEGKVDYLHPRYNCLLLFYMRDEFLVNRVEKDDLGQVREAAETPAIIHYVFQNKPWFRSGYLPKKELWYKYLANSAWANYRPVWRGGVKGMIKYYSKTFALNLGLICGFDIRPDIFRKRRYRHIQWVFLMIYYCIAQWMPNFDSRFFGRVSNKIRVFCVRRLFDYVGSNVNIGRRARFGTGDFIRIGNNSNLGAFCHVPNNIKIGDNVMMGPHNFFFGSFTHDVSDVTKPMIQQGLVRLPGNTVVNDDVWIGQDCIFMPNVEIGSHSIIGARTVVTKSVPEGVVFAGNPGCVKKFRK